MKKNGQKIIFAVVCVVIIVGLFWYTAAKKGNSAENNDDLTEVEKVITKNLEKNYPETPREVVKFYNRIITCFYDEEYTDDELYELGDQARLLMDDELLENNSRDDYFKSLKADIEDYHDKSKKIESSSVCSSDEVKYQKIDGDDCAYVSAKRRRALHKRAYHGALLALARVNGYCRRYADEIRFISKPVIKLCAHVLCNARFGVYIGQVLMHAVLFYHAAGAAAKREQQHKRRREQRREPQCVFAVLHAFTPPRPQAADAP